MSTQRVSAILVVHDGSTWLPEVVTSLATQTRGPDRIIAVDTGSVDTSAKLLKGARIPTISLDREIGFGEAISFAVGQLPPTSDSQNEWIGFCTMIVHSQKMHSRIYFLKFQNVQMSRWLDRSYLAGTIEHIYLKSESA